MAILTEVSQAQELLANGADYVAMPYTGVLAPAGAGMDPANHSPVEGLEVRLSEPSRVAVEMGALLLDSVGGRDDRTGAIYLPGEATFGREFTPNAPLMGEVMLSRGVLGDFRTPPSPAQTRSTAGQINQVLRDQAKSRGPQDGARPTIYGTLPGHDERTDYTAEVLGANPDNTHVLDLSKVQQVLAPNDGRSAQVMEVFGRKNEAPYESDARRATRMFAKGGRTGLLMGMRLGVAVKGANVVQVEPDTYDYWNMRAKEYVKELREQSAGRAS